MPYDGHTRINPSLSPVHVKFVPVDNVEITDEVHITANSLITKSIKESGIYIPAVRPPSVPKGLSRIRITLMANHSQKHMEKLKRVLKKIKKFN